MFFGGDHSSFLFEGYSFTLALSEILREQAIQNSIFRRITSADPPQIRRTSAVKIRPRSGKDPKKVRPRCGRGPDLCIRWTELSLNSKLLVVQNCSINEFEIDLLQDIKAPLITVFKNYINTVFKTYILLEYSKATLIQHSKATLLLVYKTYLITVFKIYINPEFRINN